MIVLLGVSFVMFVLALVIFIPFIFANYIAVKNRKSEVNLLFGWVKFILWQPNEGIIVLKNKNIQFVDEIGSGGTRFIYPIKGEELRARVPLTIKMIAWEDDKILTRESLQIHMKVVIWWKVSDITKYTFDIDESVHLNEKRKEIAYLDSSESWLLAITESTIRVIASRASATQLITSATAMYLDVHHNENKSDENGGQSIQTISETIAQQLHEELDQKVSPYGISINRVEIQAIRLSSEVQEAINKVWLSFLKPVQSEQEARARQIELEAMAKVLGTDTVSFMELLKSAKNINSIQPLPFVQTLFTAVDTKTQGLDFSKTNDTKISGDGFKDRLMESDKQASKE